MLHWTLGKRMWERRANPGAGGGGRRSRRKIKLHLVAWMAGRCILVHPYFCLLLAACWAEEHFCWAGMGVPLGGHCFLAWGAYGSLVLGTHVSWHLTGGGWQSCFTCCCWAIWGGHCCCCCCCCYCCLEDIASGTGEPGRNPGKATMRPDPCIFFPFWLKSVFSTSRGCGKWLIAFKLTNGLTHTHPLQSSSLSSFVFAVLISYLPSPSCRLLTQLNT